MLSENGSPERAEIIKEEISKLLGELEAGIGGPSIYIDGGADDIEKLEERSDEVFEKMKLSISKAIQYFNMGKLHDTYQGLDDVNQWAGTLSGVEQRFKYIFCATDEILDKLDELAKVI